MKIKMLGNFIGVEKKGKPSKTKDSFLHIPEAADSLGEIRFLGIEYSGLLKIGMKVYFGDKRSEVRIQGLDIQVMSPENIIALVEEDNADSEESKN